MNKKKVKMVNYVTHFYNEDMISKINDLQEFKNKTFQSTFLENIIIASQYFILAIFPE